MQVHLLYQILVINLYKIVTNNIKITHAPGPSSVINGLILSGLPTNQFYFGGFVSKNKFKEKTIFYNKKYLMTGVWFDTCLRLKRYFGNNA